MKASFDCIIVNYSDEGLVLSLPDGSSIEVPQLTIRRSALLQEAIQTLDAASKVSIQLPRGVLQDWLQCIDALKAAATSTEHGMDIASNPRLLQFIKVRQFSFVPLRGIMFASIQHLQVVMVSW